MEKYFKYHIEPYTSINDVYCFKHENLQEARKAARELAERHKTSVTIYQLKEAYTHTIHHTIIEETKVL